MKIEESSVNLGGNYCFESECEVQFSGKYSFRSILDGASEVSALPQTSPVLRDDKVRLMLEQLIAEMLALISGRPGARLTDISRMIEPQEGELAGKSRAGGREFVWESSFTERIREHEKSEFSASGKVLTADGQSVDFQLDLSMCRDYQCERQQVESGKVVMRDPLVINFAGSAAELGNVRFDFDLDGDGKSESIHGLSGNSGFLAIDRNGDGRINDGRELFGARSGDGFADLAMLDSDGNFWLDEADPAFADLRVWTRDSQGKEDLISLKDKGIGALYLGSVETPFSLKDDDNRLRGQVRATGMYLRENATVGTLQQIDLAV